MSEASDGPGTGPVEERTRRSGRPPVPPAAPPATVEQPAAPPETGRLHLGGYPPRVPGAARREAAPPDDGARDDD
ncbi:hypothetical protein [Modestobacter sp. KNN46-3]|uniref:hypothetical protein n=1 Tax=Modestobacter sp. KNN46-3 TaxID=2711218 RepID=UPI0013DEAA04|nr:hypothetical protein [Modestobacter sp. KNN46-3]